MPVHLRLDDVKTIVDKMEKGVRFRINAGRDNEVIRRLYDSNRGKVLFALPPKVKSVSSKAGNSVEISKFPLGMRC